jgi:transposase
MRALSLEGRHSRRVQVIKLRRAGQSYDQIAAETGLSRTGVFDICKRHTVRGASALHDAPGGRKAGEGRTLTRRQEGLLKGLIVANSPDELTMPEALWTRRAVGQLIEQRLGIRLPVRTLDSYLARWGFAPPRTLGRKGKSASAIHDRWMIDDYPGVAAQSKAQDGEVSWGDQHEVVGEDALVLAAATPRKLPVRGGRRRLSMISSVTNGGHRRWNTFVGALDAPILIDFLRRLIRGARKKVFLIMDDMHVPGEHSVAQWLVEHEDEIQAFDLPDQGPEHAR